MSVGLDIQLRHKGVRTNLDVDRNLCVVDGAHRCHFDFGDDHRCQGRKRRQRFGCRRRCGFGRTGVRNGVGVSGNIGGHPCRKRWHGRCNVPGLVRAGNRWNQPVGRIRRRQWGQCRLHVRSVRCRSRRLGRRWRWRCGDGACRRVGHHCCCGRWWWRRRKPVHHGIGWPDRKFDHRDQWCKRRQLGPQSCVCRSRRRWWRRRSGRCRRAGCRCGSRRRQSDCSRQLFRRRRFRGVELDSGTCRAHDIVRVAGGRIDHHFVHTATRASRHHGSHRRCDTSCW